MKKINTYVLPIRNGQHRNSLISSYCKLTTIMMICFATIHSATAQYVSNTAYEYYTIEVTAPEIKVPEEITINGYVRDETGAPLANSIVKADYGEELQTDSTGAFSFKLKKEQVTPQNIYASYTGLITGVRSYHPSMENTTYVITLYKPTVCCNKIEKCKGVNFKAFKIDFKTSSGTLPEATKKQLDVIAGLLKECPDASIYLTLHTVTNKSLQKLGDGQLDAIKNYLTEQDGITTERIKTNELIDGMGRNTVDVEAR